jgi:hypothetical protein
MNPEFDSRPEPSREELIALVATQAAEIASLPQAFHLTPRGIAKLAEIGIEVDLPKSSGQFVHRLTESQTALSFELGCRERGLEIIYPADAPAVIPDVPFILHDREYCQAVKADWRPFVILHQNERYRFFPGFENRARRVVLRFPPKNCKDWNDLA